MKRINTKIYRYLREVTQGVRSGIAAMALIEAMFSGCCIAYAYVLRRIINMAVAGDSAAFWRAVILCLTLVSVQIGCGAAKRHLYERTRSLMENHMKERLFSKLLQKDYAYVAAVHSGEWMNRLTSDTVVVSEVLGDIIPGLVGMAVKMAGAVAAICILDIRFMYFLVPGGLLILLFSAYFRKVAKPLHKHVQESDGKLRMYMQEILGSLLVVRAYALEDTVTEGIEQRMERHKAARMKKNRFTNLITIGYNIAMNGLSLAGIVFCGFGILRGAMSYGDFAAMTHLVSQIQSPLSGISGYIPRYYALLASAERLMDAETLPESRPLRVKPAQEVLSSYAEGFTHIGLRDAVFSYIPPVTELGKETKTGEKMPAVLRRVNVEIGKGEYVALVGPSGCGKSTILKLLLCLYPLDEGQRYIGLADGEHTLDSGWQGLFAYVPQGNHLMSGTIREVVSFSDRSGKEDEERIWQSLRAACAADFVSALENGLDTLLGERGHGLSEGQMQRLAIARAVFSAHPIMMLDECTSALDEESERQLLRNLRSMTDRTVLIVTHRPAVLDICDKVIACSPEQCVTYAKGETTHA